MTIVKLLLCLTVFVCAVNGVGLTRKGVLARAHAQVAMKKKHNRRPAVNRTREFFDMVDKGMNGLEHSSREYTNMVAARANLVAFAANDPESFEKRAEAVCASMTNGGKPKSKDTLAEERRAFYSIPENKAALHASTMAKIDAMKEKYLN